MGERDSSSSDNNLSDEVVHDILRKPQRKYILEYFQKCESGWCGAEEVSEYVSQHISKSNKHIKIQTHHIHLLKLDDEDVIEYDLMSKTVQDWDSDCVSELLRRTD